MGWLCLFIGETLSVWTLRLILVKLDAIGGAILIVVFGRLFYCVITCVRAFWNAASIAIYRSYNFLLGNSGTYFLNMSLAFIFSFGVARRSHLESGSNLALLGYFIKGVSLLRFETLVRSNDVREFWKVPLWFVFYFIEAELFCLDSSSCSFF